MPDVPLNMGLGSAPGTTTEEGGSILTNAYTELTPGGAKGQSVIHATEGRSLWKLISQTGPCRSLFVHRGKLYGVVGRIVVEVLQDKTVTQLGGLATDGHVTFAANRKNAVGQICVCGGGQTAIIESGVMTTISDADLPPPIDVCSIDGFFVWTIADGRLFSSSLDEGTEISALDFSTAEISPDRNVRGIARGRELIVFGEQSMQPFANDGGDQFPFVPIGGADNGVGCGAPATAVVLNAGNADTLVWVDNNGVVKATPAYDGQRISTHSVERDIENDPEWQSMTATTYTRNGHVFYVLSGSNFTKVYDFATGQWHDRLTDGKARWNGSSVTRFADKYIVGDFENGSLYELDPDTYTDAGAHMIVSVQPPVVHQYPNRLRVNSVRVDPLPGRGLNTTDEHNSDPLLMIEASKDGGKTWGNVRHVPMGKQGEFGTRVVSRRYGLTREDGIQFRFSASAATCRGFVANGSLNVDLLAT